MTIPVFYSSCPFGTDSIRTGTPNVTISGSIATLTEAQTGNIGAGCCLEYNSLKAYICPNRIAFTSGGTTELLPEAVITDATDGGTGTVRAIELTSGTWAGGNAAGFIYFSQTSGTWGTSHQINRTLPTASADICTSASVIQGNIGSGNSQFVVKHHDGSAAADQSETAVTSLHHEYASTSGFEAGFTDATHIGNTSLVTADVIAHNVRYYDHADYTADTTAVTIDFGTTGASNYLVIYAPIGEAESVNRQRHSGVWDDERDRLETSTTGPSINTINQNVKIIGLQVYRSNIQLDINGVVNVYYQNGVVIAANIIRGNNNNDWYDDGVYFDGGVGGYIYNNVIYNVGGSTRAGVRSNAPSGTDPWYVYNNTISSSTIGISRIDGKPYCKNNIIIAPDAFYGTFTDDDTVNDYNSISENNSGEVAVGSHGYYNKTVFDFVDSANGDFHLQSTSDAIDVGVDLSAQGFSTDIDGDLRGATWDIGADEYVAVGGGATETMVFTPLTFTPTILQGFTYAALLSVTADFVGMPVVAKSYCSPSSQALTATCSNIIAKSYAGIVSAVLQLTGKAISAKSYCSLSSQAMSIVGSLIVAFSAIRETMVSYALMVTM